MVVHTQHQHHNNSSFHKIEFEFDDIKKSSAPSPQTSGKKKKVRFARQNRVRLIPHINDMSDEEVDAVWMHPDDFKDIRTECQAIILIIDHDYDLVEGVELRGLEHHTLKQKKESQAIQQVLYDTVDKIQDFGDEESLDISDMMAFMCQKISSRQEEPARMIALQDEKEAKSWMAESHEV